MLWQSQWASLPSTVLVQVHEYGEGLRMRMIEIEGERKGDHIAFKLIYEEGNLRPQKIVSILNCSSCKLHYREKLGQSAEEE